MASLADDTGALFVPVDEGWLPTDRSRGPWDPNALHGGPVAALLAREVEGTDAPGPMHPARLTVELLRPVPLQPLAVQAEVTRPGRKVQLVQATITVAGDGPAAGSEVARAVAVRLRRDPTVQPPVEGTGAAPLPSPERGQAPVFWRDGEPLGFHNSSVEHRILSGGFDVPGPTTDWIRLTVPVVPGEVPTPLQRTMAVADFGNGISGVVDVERFTFINPDLTVALHRLPQGEWIGLDAVTRVGDDGIAVAESMLHDERGPIGRALQTLLVDPR
jgi:acyl-coenzyme A thioesterase PaaI-like protein